MAEPPLEERLLRSGTVEAVSGLRRFVPPGAGWLLSGGVLTGLAFPPFHLLLPSFVALVPLAIWLESLPKGDGSAAVARRGGFLFGLVYHSLVYYWLVVALIIYTPLAILAFLVPVLIMSAFLALMAWGVHETRLRLGWPVWLGLPVFWTAVEWFRGHIPDVGFPWLHFGESLTGHPWLIGAADLVGGRGLSFWLVLANALLAAGILAWWRTRRRGGDRRAAAVAARAPALALLVVLAVPIAYSAVRWTTLEMRPAARVGVVQPNVPQHIKLDRAVATDSAIRSTETLVREELADAGPIDLLVLPETAIHLEFEPVPSVGFPGRPWLEAWAAGLARRVDARFLFGSVGYDDLGGDYEYFNSAYLMASSGERLARYDKGYLVPIVERVPFVNPRWFRGLDHFGGFGIGDRRPPTLSVDDEGGARFGVLICYESIYTRLSSHYRRQGADFLVNMTNDAWFGRADDWWTQSSALWQHPAHMVMRAVETRTGVARSANTGISGIIDPLGRWSHRTELFVPAAFAGEVLTTDGSTFYVRYGDLVGWAALLAAVTGVGLCWHRRRSGPESRGSRPQASIG